MSETELKASSFRLGLFPGPDDGDEVFMRRRFLISLKEVPETGEVLDAAPFQRAVETLFFLCPELRDKDLTSITPEAVN